MCELQVKAADEIITDGNRDLGIALKSSKKTLDRKAAKTNATKTELGLGQKWQLEEHLEKLKSKKAKMSS